MDLVDERIDRRQVMQPQINPSGRCVFNCPHCSRGFSTQFELNRHLNFHEGNYYIQGIPGFSAVVIELTFVIWNVNSQALIRSRRESVPQKKYLPPKTPNKNLQIVCSKFLPKNILTAIVWENELKFWKRPLWKFVVLRYANHSMKVRTIFECFWFLTKIERLKSLSNLGYSRKKA